MAHETIKHRQAERSEIIEERFVDQLVVSAEKVTIEAAAWWGSVAGEIQPVLDELARIGEIRICHVSWNLRPGAY